MDVSLKVFAGGWCGCRSHTHTSSQRDSLLNISRLDLGSKCDQISIKKLVLKCSND